jgi:hypothetical protein
LRDPERRDRAEAERELLRRELARGFGIDGRGRRACAAAERARTAVRRAIQTALGRIAAPGPKLAEHLERSVRTGTYCAYICPIPTYRCAGGVRRTSTRRRG